MQVSEKFVDYKWIAFILLMCVALGIGILYTPSVTERIVLGVLMLTMILVNVLLFIKERN